MKLYTLSLALIILLPGIALACTCQDYQVPVCKLFSEADAVFVGKIENITSATDTNGSVTSAGVNSISWRKADLIWVHFKVDRGFKGDSSKQIKVLTYNGTSCDLGVEKGQKWIVFANKDEKTGNLTFGACGGSRSGADINGPEVEELSKLATKTTESSVIGQVSNDTYSPIKNAKVSITGKGTDISTVTNEEGMFRAVVPNDGTYKVRVTVPFSAIFLPRRDDRRIDAKPSETETVFEYEAKPTTIDCDYQYLDVAKIDLKATASISGRFVADKWKVFPKFYPRLCKLGSTEKQTLESCESDYDLKMDGSFSFDGLREGTYVIVINSKDIPDGSAPFLRTYFPGVREFAKAKPIVIEQGEEKSGLVFKLPELLPYREIKGKLFRKDGNPYVPEPSENRPYYLSAYNYFSGKEAELLFMNSFTLEWGDGKEGRSLEMINTNRDGTFSVIVFEGYSYILSVETDTWGDNGECGMIKIDVDSNLKEPLRIVLDQKGNCDEKEFGRKLDKAVKR